MKWHPPMLATLVKKPFSDPNLIFERKLDGVRCLIHKKGKEVKLYSRNRKLLNRSYPELVSLISKQKCNFVIDGEIVSFEGKRTSFSKFTWQSSSAKLIQNLSLL
jgi:bifunctional non-homologous end joining protein LigD